MHTTNSAGTPGGHTSEGGVLVGKANAAKGMVIFEDPQCPYCRQFEETKGAQVTAAAGTGKWPSNIACAVS